MISKTFILSVVFALPDLSALVTVPIAMIEDGAELNVSDADDALTLLVVNPLPLDMICPSPVPLVTITIKLSLSVAFTH